MLFFNLDLLTPNCETEMEIGRERKNEKKTRERRGNSKDNRLQETKN
jgi:hypothetical protein